MEEPYFTVDLFDSDNRVEKYTTFSNRKTKDQGGKAIYKWSIRQYDNEVKMTHEQMQQILDLAKSTGDFE